MRYKFIIQLHRQIQIKVEGYQYSVFINIDFFYQRHLSQPMQGDQLSSWPKMIQLFSTKTMKTIEDPRSKHHLFIISFFYKANQEIIRESSLNQLHKSKFMSKQLENGQVKDICGFASKHFVTFRISQSEKLQITLQNHQSMDTYCRTVTSQQIKKQNMRSQCHYIETSTQLFQYIQYCLSQNIEFSDIVKIDNKGKIIISLTVKIDFGQGTKKKAVVYEFITTKQSVSVVQKIKKQISNMGQQNHRFQKEIVKRIQQLQQQNRSLRSQLTLYPELPSAEYVKQKQKINKDSLRFCSNRKSLIVKNDCFTQVQNKLNTLLFGDNLYSRPSQIWKIRVCNKTVLVFGIGTEQICQKTDNDRLKFVEQGKMVIKQFFNGGEIITLSFQQGELKYVIQKLQIEEDENSAPQPNYNMRRGSFMCKKILRLQQYYLCIGLYFGGQVELLSYSYPQISK